MLTPVHNDVDNTDDADNYNRVIGIALLKVFSCANKKEWLKCKYSGHSNAKIQDGCQNQHHNQTQKDGYSKENPPKFYQKWFINLSQHPTNPSQGDPAGPRAQLCSCTKTYSPPAVYDSYRADVPQVKTTEGEGIKIWNKQGSQMFSSPKAQHQQSRI